MSWVSRLAHVPVSNLLGRSALVLVAQNGVRYSYGSPVQCGEPNSTGGFLEVFGANPHEVWAFSGLCGLPSTPPVIKRPSVERLMAFFRFESLKAFLA